ncbi:MAG TPA: Hsp20/alpha crystallin family protein [Candidatus Baltobacteraceae bacterium]|nr:Hsp20/alpha crystallin family protein [Candidatus Baltobacteraceae bacterium]
MALLKTKNGGSNLALLDEMFDTFLDWQQPTSRFTYAATPLDLYEQDGKYVLEMSVPGFDPKDINVEVSGGTVSVTGEHTEKTEKQDVRYHRREMRHGSFSRTITLPHDLDSNAVTAKIDKGILKVELIPIKQLSPKKIEVKPA